MNSNENIADDIIADAFEEGRVLYKDDVAEAIWEIISKNVQGSKYVLDRTENGEVVAWEFIKPFTPSVGELQAKYMGMGESNIPAGFDSEGYPI